MVLSNVNIIGDECSKFIRIDDEKITAISDKPFQDSFQYSSIELDGAIAFPGLINSHDHLDFNLFPSLKNRAYSNYTEWGKDIHEQNKGIINAVLKIPKALRVQWGVYKNLLSGVTTV